MKNKIKISNKEIQRLLEIEPKEFPKYATQILNLANQNAQGTRPPVVGQMSDLIQEFTGKSAAEWEKWYLQRHPDAIERATIKIFEMVEKFKDVILQIDKEMVEKWVHDLVIFKTFIGLKFQEAILRKTSELLGQKYSLASPENEARGIDGFIGTIPVSIKPITYKTKSSLAEKIDAKIIFYEKKSDGILIDISNLISEK